MRRHQFAQCVSQGRHRLVQDPSQKLGGAFASRRGKLHQALAWRVGLDRKEEGQDRT